MEYKNTVACKDSDTSPTKFNIYFCSLNFVVQFFVAILLYSSVYLSDWYAKDKFLSASTSLIMLDFFTSFLNFLYTVRTSRLSRIFFCLNLVTSSFPYFIISGIMNAIYKLQFEMLILPILFEIFLRFFLISFFWKEAKTMITAFFTSVAVIYTSVIVIHDHLNSKLVSYYIIYTATQLIMVLLAKLISSINMTRKEFEDALTEERNDYLKLITELNVGVIKIKNSKIAFLNNKVNEVFGYKIDEHTLIGVLGDIKPYDLIKESSIFTKILNFQGTIKEFTTFLNLNVQELSGFIRLGQIEVANKSFEVAIEHNINNTNILIIDVTEAKEKEQIKVESNMKHIFLAKIAHEIINPIITIDSKAEISQSLIERLSIANFERLHNRITSEISSIRMLSTYITQLVHDFKTYACVTNKSSRIASPITSVVSKIDLAKLLKFVAIIFETRLEFEKKNYAVTFVRDFKDIYLSLEVDEMKLKQILINLLSNSVKFTSEGEIKLSATKIINNNSLEVKFCVSDTGVGMSEDKLVKISEGKSKKADFYVEEGSNIGLIIVKELLIQLNSKLEITSQVGKGTSVEFSLRFDSYENITNSIQDSQLDEDEDRTVKYNEPFNIQDIKKKTKKVHFEKDFEQINNKTTKEPLARYYFQFQDKSEQFDRIQSKSVIQRIPSFNEQDEFQIVNLVFCDDDNVILTSYLKMFEKVNSRLNFNLKTHVCIDGIECLNKIRILSKTKEKIGFLVIDETMPYMTGSMVISILKSSFEKKEISAFPLYSITAYYDDLTVNHIKEKGASMILNKPIKKTDMEMLLHRLE